MVGIPLIVGTPSLTASLFVGEDDESMVGMPATPPSPPPNGLPLIQNLLAPASILHVYNFAPKFLLPFCALVQESPKEGWHELIPKRLKKTRPP
jgi:hypothetical protein